MYTTVDTKMMDQIRDSSLQIEKIFYSVLYLNQIFETMIISIF